MTTHSINRDNGVVTWGPLGASVNGETLPVRNKSLILAAVAMTGTFGGTVTLQGSLDGTNWYTLKDTTGADIALTAAGLRELSTAVPYIRPITGVGVSAVTIRIALGSV